MEPDDLTAALLRDLRVTRPHPAVSLTMPTHRREPENAQDEVRLRNLLAEAERRIDADPNTSRQARIALREQMEQAAAEVDLRHALDGLVLYVTPDEHQIWSVPREVPERVVLSDSFLTRNLVAARAQARPLWVLALSADRATLWSGSSESLHQHQGDGFPAVPEATEWDVQNEQRTGGTPSTFSDEETRRFLRTVDTALGAVLQSDPRPLYLVGLPEAVTMLQEVGTSASAPVGTVLKGGLVDGPDRAGLVAVEEHFQRTARLTDGHLSPADGRTAERGEEGVREDIVDELLETALDKGTEVVFLPDDHLAEHDHIAAVLRY
ncbi:baeRF3 domain-containing protein [Peterkaempfera griseoplana]|uniref:baeRF3 domain-containing protein n=1 Tax=Peterkaempfera griseoplana TaxID=66896 RepID=UPI0006E1F53F|nr:hypothetical protein [Peterkaempfera griseoplana]